MQAINLTEQRSARAQRSDTHRGKYRRRSAPCSELFKAATAADNRHIAQIYNFHR